MTTPDNGSDHLTGLTIGGRNVHRETLALYTNSTEAPLVCDKVEGHCGLRFDEFNSLVQHIRQTHSTSENDVGDQDGVHYLCPKCQKQFDGGGDLKRHLRADHDIIGLTELRLLVGRASGRRNYVRMKKDNKLEARREYQRQRRGSNGSKNVVTVTDHPEPRLAAAQRSAGVMSGMLNMARALPDGANFCPRCGCNMHNVNLAMNFKG